MVYDEKIQDYKFDYNYVNEYMAGLHEQIFALSNAGKLGSVVDMFKLPKFLRDYYYNKLVEQSKQQQQLMNQHKNSSKTQSRPNYGKRYTK